ncbi:hypothetical protein NUSPORA_02844 [Nucleospora cyclopteri]
MDIIDTQSKTAENVSIMRKEQEEMMAMADEEERKLADEIMKKYEFEEAVRQQEKEFYEKNLEATQEKIENIEEERKDQFEEIEEKLKNVLITDVVNKSISETKEEWRKEDFKSFNLNQCDFILLTDVCSSNNHQFKRSSMKRKKMSFIEYVLTLGCFYEEQQEYINARVIVLQTERNVSKEITIDTENIKLTLIDNNEEI